MHILSRKALIYLSVLALQFVLSISATAAEPEAINFSVNEFEIDGTVPISADLVDEALAPFEDKKHSVDSLREAAKALENVIRDQGLSFYRVVVPPQTLDQGVVKLRIVEFVLGDVALQGNHHFDASNVRQALPDLLEGQSPNTEELAQQLKVANRQPSKELKLTFKQSEQSGLVDAVLNVEEQAPQQLSLIATNTGNDTTGEARITAAYQYSNLWNRDHLVNGSYTTSPGHLDEVRQYGLSYSLPLYSRKAWLSAYTVHSDIDNGTVANVFSVSGAGDMSGLHWLQYLPRIGRFEHWLDIGLDSRNFENDIDFLAVPIGVDVRSFPVSLLYKGEYSWPSTRLNFHVQYLVNTGFGDKNDAEDYAASRVGASDSWEVYRYGATLDRNIGKFVLRGIFDGQFSKEPLISGEQFGIGGSTSVRGYEERETAADKGATFKLELHSPKYNGFSLVGFYDYGYGRLHNPQASEDPGWSVSSLGLGVRAAVGKNLLFSIDLAHTLKDQVDTDANKNQVHAVLVMQY